MWRLFVLAFLILLIFGVFYDLKFGTLPQDVAATEDVSEQVTTQEAASDGTYVYYIQSGDSVISIVEEHEGGLPISVETVIYDFINLNGGADPSALVVGDSYIFKDY